VALAVRNIGLGLFLGALFGIAPIFAFFEADCGRVNWKALVLIKYNQQMNLIRISIWAAYGDYLMTRQTLGRCIYACTWL
jgi:hypothetical protein